MNDDEDERAGERGPTGGRAEAAGGRGSERAPRESEDRAERRRAAEEARRRRRERRARRRRRLGTWAPSALAGGLLFFALAALDENDPVSSFAAGLVGGLVGALYGVAVGGLVRLFPVHPVAYPAAGLLAAPAVGALFVGSGDVGEFLFLGGLFGLVLGVLEYGAARRATGAPESGPEGGRPARGEAAGVGNAGDEAAGEGSRAGGGADAGPDATGLGAEERS